MPTFIVPYMPSADLPAPKPEDRLVAFRKMFQKVLTPAQRRKVAFIYRTKESHERASAFAELLEPVMPKIDKYTGQENNLRYFAYALDWVVSSYKGDPFMPY